MPTARNDAELLAMISKDFLKITEDTSKYVLDQTVKEIELTVYGLPQSPWYERHNFDGGYVGSWEQMTGMNGPNEIIGTVFSDPFTMIFDEQIMCTDRHIGATNAANMTENIIKGMNYDWGGNAAIQRDFWVDVEQMVSDGSLDAIFEKGMISKGINFIKI